MDKNKLYKLYKMAGSIVIAIIIIGVGFSLTKKNFFKEVGKTTNKVKRESGYQNKMNEFFDILYNGADNSEKTIEELDNNVEGASAEKVSEIDFNNDDLNILFFYVGQADSMFIKLKDKTMLIDAGNNLDGKKIVEYLKSNNISKIDYLIGTHADEDHIGGLDNVISELEVDKIIMPKIGSDTVNYKMAKRRADEKNIEITNPNVGDKYSFGDGEIEIMAAMETYRGYPVDSNNSSIVVELTYANKKMLFMGDSEDVVEYSREWNDVDILKVGHHGSSSSTTEKFLDQTKPEYAFIEVGKNNDYYLPNKKIVARIEKKRAKVYRTDINQSSFWVRVNSDSIDIKEVPVNLDGN